MRVHGHRNKLRRNGRRHRRGAGRRHRPVGRILANVVYSQLTEHRRFGGVVPEIAARAHLERIDGLVERGAGRPPGSSSAELDGIAATGGPGLIGGVMVGVMTAKALAFAHDKPFLAINHLEGHALSVRLTEEVALSLSAAAGLGRTLPAPDRARSGRLHAARHHHRRRGRRMLRQDGEASGPGLSRRTGRRAGGEGRRSAALRPAAADVAASPAATSPSPASRRRCARPSRSSLAGDKQARSPISAPRSSAPSATFWPTAAPTRSRSAPIVHARRGGRRRGQPLSARPPRRGCRPARRPSGGAAGEALHRQRRHDRLGRHRAAAARQDRCARFPAAAALAARCPARGRCRIAA